MSWSKEFAYQDCPWCETKNIAFNVTKSQSIHTSKGSVREWTPMYCPRCGGAVFIETDLYSPMILRIVPKHASSSDVRHVPEQVSKHYIAAIKVLEAGVPSSAAVELRKTLEAAVRFRGIDKTPLVSAITELSNQGLITKDFVTVLGHIRKIGNAGAHSSDEDVTEDEAQVALHFTTQVLRNLFEVPAELAALES